MVTGPTHAMALSCRRYSELEGMAQGRPTHGSGPAHRDLQCYSR